MPEWLLQILSTPDGAVTTLVVLLFMSPTFVLAALAVHWFREMWATRAPHDYTATEKIARLEVSVQEIRERLNRMER